MFNWHMHNEKVKISYVIALAITNSVSYIHVIDIFIMQYFNNMYDIELVIMCVCM